MSLDVTKHGTLKATEEVAVAGVNWWTDIDRQGSCKVSSLDFNLIAIRSHWK